MRGAAAPVRRRASTPRRAFERWLAPRRELLATIALRGTWLDDEDVARLLGLSLPGIDEVVGLLEIARMARAATERSIDVVVDTAPTGHTLRLLAAPALLGRVARRARHAAGAAPRRRQRAARLVPGRRRRRADRASSSAKAQSLAALLRDPAGDAR